MDSSKKSEQCLRKGRKEKEEKIEKQKFEKKKLENIDR